MRNKIVILSKEKTKAASTAEVMRNQGLAVRALSFDECAMSDMEGVGLLYVVVPGYGQLSVCDKKSQQYVHDPRIRRIALMPDKAEVLIASLMDHGFTAIETLNRKNDKPPVIRREVCQPELPYCQRLSAREVQVLVLIGQGYDNNEIMWKLGIAQTTLSTHIKNLLNKTGMRTRCQLVLFAVRKHLVSVL